MSTSREPGEHPMTVRDVSTSSAPIRRYVRGTAPGSYRIARNVPGEAMRVSEPRPWANSRNRDESDFGSRGETAAIPLKKSAVRVSPVTSIPERSKRRPLLDF